MQKLGPLWPEDKCKFYEYEWRASDVDSLVRAVKKFGEHWQVVARHIYRRGCFNPSEFDCRQRWFILTGDPYDDREEIYQDVVSRFVPSYNDEIGRKCSIKKKINGDCILLNRTDSFDIFK